MRVLDDLLVCLHARLSAIEDLDVSDGHVQGRRDAPLEILYTRPATKNPPPLPPPLKRYGVWGNNGYRVWGYG